MARKNKNNLANILGQSFTGDNADELLSGERDTVNSITVRDHYKKPQNLAHIENSGNSKVSLNIDSTLKQENEVLEDGETQGTNQNILNEQLLASLIPLLNKLIRENK